MSQTIQSLIAASVNGVLRRLYPDNYSSLCHAHAIVGANVISLVLNRVYRPVAGLAMIDCGGGNFLRLIDNTAFDNPIGGAFHCWIESADENFGEKEVVDLTFRHNHEYALKNGTPWLRQAPPEYLWGKHSKIVVRATLDNMPAIFDEGTVWLRETDEGWRWITSHLADNMNAYVTLTSETLREMQRLLPPASTLLDSVFGPRAAQPAASPQLVRTNSARASAPNHA